MGRIAQSCLVILLLAACKQLPNEPTTDTRHPNGADSVVVATDTLPPYPDDEVAGFVVLQTDTDEWLVQIFKEHILYADAAEINLPAPWVIPTRDDALVLHTLSFAHQERFITSDGFTFAMPSASVTRAGQKTYYSVLGLYRRRTVIVVGF